MMLAHYARYQHKLAEAFALAGMALVLNPLDPGTYDVLADLCQQSAAADSTTGPSVIEPIYRKLADLARQGYAAELAASHEEITHTDDEPVTLNDGHEHGCVPVGITQMHRNCLVR